MTQSQLEKLLKKWQKILRLQDWVISISFAHHYQLVSSQRVGEVSSNLEQKDAHISVLVEPEVNKEDFGGAEVIDSVAELPDVL